MNLPLSTLLSGCLLARFAMRSAGRLAAISAISAYLQIIVSFQMKVEFAMRVGKVGHFWKYLLYLCCKELEVIYYKRRHISRENSIHCNQKPQTMALQLIFMSRTPPMNENWPNFGRKDLLWKIVCWLLVKISIIIVFHCDCCRDGEGG